MTMRYRRGPFKNVRRDPLSKNKMTLWGKWIRSASIHFFFMGMMSLSLLSPSLLDAQDETPLPLGADGDVEVVESDNEMFVEGNGDGTVIWKNPPYSFNYPLMDCVGYIKPQAVPAIGKIVDTLPLRQKSIEKGGKVYLEIEDESMVAVGDRFQLIRVFDLGGGSSDINGKQHYITGIVEIVRLSSTDPCCGVPRSRARGKIVTAYRAIEIDDLLIPYNTQKREIPMIGTNEALRGKILFSEEHADAISENAVVFIDKGKIHGLKVGQPYDIYNHSKAERAPSAPYMEKREYKGSLMVIRMEDETAAALITYAYKPISPGDLFFPSKKTKM